MGDAPPFWIVSSSNGLIHMTNCHIENVTVNYYGPWVESPKNSNFLNDFLSSQGSSLDSLGADNLAIKNVFPNAQLIGTSKSIGYSGLGGYPSYATVSITFKHSLSKVFGEEFLLSMTGAGSHFGAGSTGKTRG